MSEPRGTDNNAEDWRVGPSDIGQSLVRVIIVGGVVAWSWVRAGRPALAALDDYDYLVLPVDYFACAIALLLWSWLLARRGTQGLALHVRRSCGVVADVVALSAYTALGGYHALIVFPFYLTVIIGYGYRFGLGYLNFAILASFVGFGIAYPRNPAFGLDPALVWSYYLSLVCVPCYAALLLRRHQSVLYRLHEVNEARSRFIANISHELRTPLHTIISSAHAGLEAQDDGQQRETALQLINEAARHLLTLVNRVLDIAAAQAGSLRLVIGPTDLYALVRAAVEICRPQAAVKGIGCHCRIDPEVPRHILSAGPQIQEVLINLLGNAIKFTTAGHARLEVGTRRSAAGQSHLFFRITDTGPGIPARLLGRLFQPFTLGDAGTARAQPGTGLGLAISKDYVEALGGTLVVRSSEGAGTTCEATLPLQPAASPGRPLPEAPQPCVVIAPCALSTSEYGSFAHAGFDPLCMTLRCWQTQAATRHPPVIFVHPAYFDAPELHVGGLRSRGPRPLLVAYGVNAEEAQALPLVFESRAGFASVADLSAIRDLLSARGGNEAARVEPAVTPLRILVVDDNLTNLLAAGHALRAAGHAVDCASTPDEALRRIDAAPYDAALVDLHLPGTSGLELVARIRARCATPCAILTADVTAAAHDAALGSGAVGVLTKPIPPAELRAAVLRIAATQEPLLLGPLFADVLADVPAGPPVAQLIASFEQECRSLVEELRAAAAGRDLPRRGRILHRLKACAAAMGADALLDSVSALEKSQPEPPADALDTNALAGLVARTVAAMAAAAGAAPPEAPSVQGGPAAVAN